MNNFLVNEQLLCKSEKINLTTDKDRNIKLKIFSHIRCDQKVSRLNLKVFFNFKG